MKRNWSYVIAARRLACAASVLSTWFSYTSALATTYTWTGSVGGDWNNVNNWDSNGVPVDTVVGGNLDLRNSTDRIVFDGAEGNEPVPTSNIPVFSGGDAFNGNNSNTPEIDLLFGSLSLTVAVWNGQGLIQRPTWDSSVGDGITNNGSATLTYNMQGNQINRDDDHVMAWTVNEDGELTITNPGATLDFSYNANRTVSFTVGGTLTFTNGILLEG